MRKRLLQTLGVLAAAAAVVGLAAFVYTGWDWLWPAVTSPVGALVAKVAFTGKTVKVVIGIGLAIAAAVVGIRKRLRRDDPGGARSPLASAAQDAAAPPAVETDPAAPPVFLPPDPAQPQVPREVDRDGRTYAAPLAPPAPDARAR
jgi:hypothetical protein